MVVAAEGFIFLFGFFIELLRRYIEHRRIMRDMRLIEKNGYIAEKIIKMTDEVSKAVAELKKLGYAITEIPKGADKTAIKSIMYHRRFKKLL